MSLQHQLRSHLERLDFLERAPSTSANGLSVSRQLHALRNRIHALHDALLGGGDRIDVERRVLRMGDQIEALELAQKLDSLRSLPPNAHMEASPYSSLADVRLPYTDARPLTRLFSKPPLATRAGFVTPSGAPPCMQDEAASRPVLAPLASRPTPVTAAAYIEGPAPLASPPPSRASGAAADAGGEHLTPGVREPPAPESRFSAKKRFEELRTASRAAALFARSDESDEQPLKAMRLDAYTPQPPSEPLSARPAPRPTAYYASRPGPVLMGGGATPVLMGGGATLVENSRGAGRLELRESSRPPLREAEQAEPSDSWAVDIPGGGDQTRQQLVLAYYRQSDAPAEEEDGNSARGSVRESSKGTTRKKRKGGGPAALAFGGVTPRSRLMLMIGGAVFILVAVLALAVTLVASSPESDGGDTGASLHAHGAVPPGSSLGARPNRTLAYIPTMAEDDARRRVRMPLDSADEEDATVRRRHPAVASSSSGQAPEPEPSAPEHSKFWQRHHANSTAAASAAAAELSSEPAMWPAPKG
ncbi:hypothetical protein T492DRAFT_949998 [Pavlovales sp. CCMP2436]|nr:hypothetical protein T492DRAFT_949998 [Pavlovales sp. CCMP2436]